MDLAEPELQVRPDVPGGGDGSTALAAHQPRQPPRQVALVGVRQGREQPVGDREAQHPVSEEFEPLVAAAAARGGADMGDRPDQQRPVAEPVADPLLEDRQVRARARTLAGPGRRSGRRLDLDGAVVGVHVGVQFGPRQWIGLNSRLQRTVQGQFHTCHAARALVDREEDDLRPADEVLERHVADAAEVARVGGVVAVVAHHEEVVGRHGVDAGVVPQATVAVAFDDRVRDAVRQRLGVLGDLGRLAEGVGGRVVGDLLALHRPAVDVEQAVDHLDAVAGQADHPLDVVGGIVLRQLEHRDVAALGLGPQIRPWAWNGRYSDSGSEYLEYP